MLADNDHYGHGDILRAYAGVGSGARIPGRLQHGWNPEAGVPQVNLSDPWRSFIWSDRNAHKAAAAGGQRTQPIGAPYLYLPVTEPLEPEANSLLVFPFHGWERESVGGDFERYARELEAEVEGAFESVTVCMYWLEYDDPDLRAIFERRGWAVVTNGHRDDNPRFLYRQRELIERHALVTSNRVCTAAFYALASKRPFVLWGPSMGLSGTDDPDGALFDAWQRSEFPSLVTPLRPQPPLTEDDPRHQLGLLELGANHRLSPERLRELLGWRGVPLIRGWALRAWPPLSRTFKRLFGG